MWSQGRFARDRGADLVYGKCLRREERTGWKRLNGGRPSRGQLMLEMPVNIQAVLARRWIYDRIGGMDPLYEYRSDYDWLIRAARLDGVVKRKSDVTVCVHYWGGSRRTLSWHWRRCSCAQG